MLMLFQCYPIVISVLIQCYSVYVCKSSYIRRTCCGILHVACWALVLQLSLDCGFCVKSVCNRVVIFAQIATSCMCMCWVCEHFGSLTIRWLTNLNSSVHSDRSLYCGQGRKGSQGSQWRKGRQCRQDSRWFIIDAGNDMLIYTWKRATADYSYIYEGSRGLNNAAGNRLILYDIDCFCVWSRERVIVEVRHELLSTCRHKHVPDAILRSLDHSAFLLERFCYALVDIHILRLDLAPPRWPWLIFIF